MPTTHSEIVKARAGDVGNLTDDAVDKFTSTILKKAASKMESRLGSANYGNYVTMFTENQYDPDTEYHELEDGQKKLWKLETAEAYYALYYLALALKEMQDNDVITTKMTFGEGSINPAPIQQVIDMKNQYKHQADKITSEYGAGGLFVGSA